MRNVSERIKKTVAKGCLDVLLIQYRGYYKTNAVSFTVYFKRTPGGDVREATHPVPRTTGCILHRGDAGHSGPAAEWSVRHGNNEGRRKHNGAGTTAQQLMPFSGNDVDGHQTGAERTAEPPKVPLTRAGGSLLLFFFGGAALPRGGEGTWPMRCAGCQTRSWRRVVIDSLPSPGNRNTAVHHAPASTHRRSTGRIATARTTSSSGSWCATRSNHRTAAPVIQYRSSPRGTSSPRGWTYVR